MRWDRLFDDLEAQFDAAASAEFAAEVADRARREHASVRVIDRLRPNVGSEISVRVQGGGQLTGSLTRVGPDWILLAVGADGDALVPLHAVLSVAGLAARTAAPGSGGVVAERLALGYALRAVMRDRAPVVAVLLDGSTTTGTIDRVGADFFEVAEHAAGEVRRRDAVSGVRTVAFAGLALVRRT